MLRYVFIHLECRFLIPLPALCGFHYRRTWLALSLNSSLLLPASVPGEDHCSFFPFILRVRHLENRLCLRHFPSHSIIVMFIQPSILSTAPLAFPFSPPLLSPTWLALHLRDVTAFKHTTAVSQASFIHVYLFQIEFFLGILPPFKVFFWFLPLISCPPQLHWDYKM